MFHRVAYPSCRSTGQSPCPMGGQKINLEFDLLRSNWLARNSWWHAIFIRLWLNFSFEMFVIDSRWYLCTKSWPICIVWITSVITNSSTFKTLLRLVEMLFCTAERWATAIKIPKMWMNLFKNYRKRSSSPPLISGVGF